MQSVLGGELAWVADNDPGASKILAHHYPDVPNLGDITTINWATVWPGRHPPAAGYPCQPFSDAGPRKGTDDERWIWPHFVPAIRVLRPRLVVLENVRGHLGRGFDAVLGDLAALGFDAEWVTMPARPAWEPATPASGCSSSPGLLKTPTAQLAVNGGSQPPEKRKAGGHGPTLADQVEHELLPTPSARDWKSGASNIMDRNARPLNEVVQNCLLPTPRATDG